MELFAKLKVIDCASFIAAPAAATVMSDFGADVIKIEPLGSGDDFRWLSQRPGYPISDLNYGWMLDGRNKRSLALDLKSDEGLAVLHRLAATADVFITNLLPPVRERLKIGYHHLAPENPRLIYASFTAYGETGPEVHRTGFDTTAYWARSGLMDQVKPDASAEPARSVVGMGDHPSAMALFAAIVCALYRRERTGKGGKVSSSLLANGLWANGFLAQAVLCGARIAPRPPRLQLPNACTSMYKTRDGRWVMLSVLNELRQFAPLVAAMDRSDLAIDQRFATVEARRANALALSSIFDTEFAKRDLSDWRVRLDGAGITFGVVGRLDEIADDEQMRASGAVVPFADGSGLTIASPITFEGEIKRPPGPAPAIGEHGNEILREAGYSDGEINRLRRYKVVG
jgi:crotonobetainyl-CoA:carnitine CoA-transferase CaiB-like acyl-CoA transferase